jgi:hypothetical protein
MQILEKRQRRPKHLIIVTKASSVFCTGVKAAFEEPVSNNKREPQHYRDMEEPVGGPQSCLPFPETCTHKIIGFTMFFLHGPTGMKGMMGMNVLNK